MGELILTLLIWCIKFLKMRHSEFKTAANLVLINCEPQFLLWLLIVHTNFIFTMSFILLYVTNCGFIKIH